MSCRCIHEQWQRDRDRQRGLAKKLAVMINGPVILLKKSDGTYGFVAEGNDYEGEIIEIITQY